jgi:hypothetical protein
LLLLRFFRKLFFIKVSTRNQNGKENTNLLMKKAIKGLKNANGGAILKLLLLNS